MNNRLLVSGGKKRLKLVLPFTRQEFCKFIGGGKYTRFGVKYQKLLVIIHKINYIEMFMKNRNIHNICCDIYCPYYCYACH